MTDTAHTATFRIDHDHPALPGHFPGNPVVPGVVLLERVLDAAEAWLGRPLAPSALPQVKFVHPLLPGQQACVQLQAQGGRIRFKVLRDDTLLASGEFEAGA